MTTGKLVRDRVPELIARAGGAPEATRLEGEALRAALYDKLTEERAEVVAARSADERLEELADMVEVVLALAALDDCDHARLMARAAEKRAERGGFAEGWFLLGAG